MTHQRFDPNDRDYSNPGVYCDFTRKQATIHQSVKNERTHACISGPTEKLRHASQPRPQAVSHGTTRAEKLPKAKEQQPTSPSLFTEFPPTMLYLALFKLVEMVSMSDDLSPTPVVGEAEVGAAAATVRTQVRAIATTSGFAVALI